jgi:hypothetical protein
MKKNCPQMYDAREQLEQSGFETQATTSKKGRRRKNNKKKKKEAPQTVNPESKVPVVAMEDDVLVIPGQMYAVLSFVDKRDYTGTCEGDADNVGQPLNLIKIRGVFPTHERANSRVKELMTVDPYFDVHIVKCGTWTTIGAGNGEDVTYENEGVDKIMSSFFDKHYTDMDSLKSRIADAKKAGMPNLDEADPKRFFDAAQSLGETSHKAEVLPGDAVRMSAKEASAMMKDTSTLEESLCWESDEE